MSLNPYRDLMTPRERALLIVNLAWSAYPEGFHAWLDANYEAVWEPFCRMAEQVRQQGRERYSARTIVEVMRWNTDIREADKTFKIQNNAVPGMARLYNAMTGIALFSLREKT